MVILVGLEVLCQGYNKKKYSEELEEEENG
jgi:hypothetical protein